MRNVTDGKWRSTDRLDASLVECADERGVQTAIVGIGSCISALTGSAERRSRADIAYSTAVPPLGTVHVYTSAEIAGEEEKGLTFLRRLTQRPSGPSSVQVRLVPQGAPVIPQFYKQRGQKLSPTRV